MTLEQIIEAERPEDIFGDLPEGRDAAVAVAGQAWRAYSRQFHPDVCDDSRCARAMTQLNVMFDQVRAGRYGTSNVDVVIQTRRHGYKLSARVAQGDACDVFSATYLYDSHGPQNALIKIVRDRRNNDLIANEAKMLKRLLSNTATFDHLSPYVSEYIEAFGYRPGGQRQARQAIAFRATPNLYTLREVRERYPLGVNARHAAWMFRRLLYTLMYVHTNDVIHGALTPDHILIEPAQHGLVLIDWKYAVDAGGKLVALPTSARGMYPPELLDKQPATRGADLFMAARCMAYVMGGDPATGLLPARQPRQMQAFLNGTALARAKGRPQDAAVLRDEFTALIERLWGPRRFMPFAM